MPGWRPQASNNTSAFVSRNDKAEDELAALNKWNPMEEDYNNNKIAYAKRTPIEIAKNMTNQQQTFRANYERGVYISSISRITTEDTLRNIFKTCGKIESVRIIDKNSSEEGYVYGFIIFEKSESALQAVQKFNKIELDGRRLVVELNSAKKLRSPKNEKKNICAVCGEPGKFNCTKCNKTYYCSGTCLVKDETIHANRCISSTLSYEKNNIRKSDKNSPSSNRNESMNDKASLTLDKNVASGGNVCDCPIASQSNFVNLQSESKYDLMLTSVVRDNDFYCVLNTKECENFLLDLNEKLSNIALKKFTGNIGQGYLVIAPFEGGLYRAVVLSTVSVIDDTVKLFFVDYGNSESVLKTDVLYTLDSDVVNTKYQSIKCSFDNPKHFYNIFKGQSDGIELNVTIVSRQSRTYIIDPECDNKKFNQNTCTENLSMGNDSLNFNESCNNYSSIPYNDTSKDRNGQKASYSSHIREIASKSFDKGRNIYESGERMGNSGEIQDMAENYGRANDYINREDPNKCVDNKSRITYENGERMDRTKGMQYIAGNYGRANSYMNGEEHNHVDSERNRVPDNIRRNIKNNNGDCRNLREDSMRRDNASNYKRSDSHAHFVKRNGSIQSEHNIITDEFVNPYAISERSQISPEDRQRNSNYGQQNAMNSRGLQDNQKIGNRHQGQTSQKMQNELVGYADVDASITYNQYAHQVSRSNKGNRTEDVQHMQPVKTFGGVSVHERRSAGHFYFEPYFPCETQLKLVVVSDPIKGNFYAKFQDDFSLRLQDILEQALIEASLKQNKEEWKTSDHCLFVNESKKNRRGKLMQILEDNSLVLMDIDDGTKHICDPEVLYLPDVNLCRTSMNVIHCEMANCESLLQIKELNKSKAVLTCKIKEVKNELGLVYILEVLTKREVALIEFSRSSSGKAYHGDDIPNKETLISEYEHSSVKILSDFSPTNEFDSYDEINEAASRPYRNINVPVGTCFKALICNFISIHDFFVHLLNSDSLAKLRSINNEIVQSEYDETIQRTQLDVGTSVIAKCMRQKNWERGIVLADNGCQITVLFIDYGVREIVKRNNICSTPDSLKKEPPLAIRVCIYGCESLSNEEEKKLINTHIKSDKNSVVQISFVEYNDGKYSVKLV